MPPDSDEKEPPTFDALLSSMGKDELSLQVDRINAQNMGLTLEAYRDMQLLNESLYEEGEKYRGRPPSEWPPLAFNWDFSLEGQRFGYDGLTAHAFKVRYPEGLRLGYMPLATFDRHLAHFSRRDTTEELWELGSEFKLAKAIAYIHRGLPITPPVVGPNGCEVVLKGGHHRYAIAKAINLKTIPFLVAPEDVEHVARTIEATWGEPPLANV